MDISIFTDKSNIPTPEELEKAIGSTIHIWNEIVDYAHKKYPKAIDEWNYPGKNYGWSFRVKDKKRTIVYLLPREGYFKVAFMFGQKAFDTIMASDIDSSIKKELADAKVYVEGRGIRIDVKDDAVFKDIKKLIDIKVEN